MKNGEGHNSKNSEKTTLFAQVLISNNRRLFTSFLGIFLLGNAATLAIKITGRGSQYLTFFGIGVEFTIVIFIIAATYLAERKLEGKKISGYITITAIILCLWIYQYIIFGATELSAVHYIALTLSIFYFDKKTSIYTFFLVLVSQTALFTLRPELLPGGPASNLLVRYLVYIWVGIGAAVGAHATRQILELAIMKNEEALRYAESLKVTAHDVKSSIEVLKMQIREHEGIAEKLNNISHGQASSMEEFSAAIEELSASAESLSGVAKALNRELSVNNECVGSLKLVNDSAQKSARSVNTRLTEVSRISRESLDQINNARDRFNVLKNKSGEMYNFVQVINDIADQVNLLSLNASIEAARAGDYGRGFAVVADEISKLADATTSNSKEIARIIGENRSVIDDSDRIVESSAGLMEKLNDSVNGISEEITEVGVLILDIDTMTRSLTNLNAKIYETSRQIESATSEQKISTGELMRSTAQLSENSQEIVGISFSVMDCSTTIKELTGKLDGHATDLLGA